MGFKRLGVLGHVDTGHAVVNQPIRGVGAIGGRFVFSAPPERSAGFDTVEWATAKPWCTGSVGLDGSSDVAMTQFAADAAHPPWLRSIAPALPCVDFFREVRGLGGVFSRQHTLNWMHVAQIDSLDDLSSGLTGTRPLLSRPERDQRTTARLLRHAVDSVLEGDYLKHHFDAREHDPCDAWWRTRKVSAEWLGRIDVPVPVVSGTFDLGVGAMALWQGLMSTGEPTPHRRLAGRWDHGQSCAGGATSHGPFDMGEHSVSDLGALRQALFDQHLGQRSPGLPSSARALMFTLSALRTSSPKA
jgi:uncharacterized protein